MEVEEEEVGWWWWWWWWWLPCESAGDVRHDWRVQQHLQRTTVQPTARIQKLRQAQSDRYFSFTKLSFIRAKSIPHGDGFIMTTIKATIEIGRDGGRRKNNVS